MWVSTSTSPRVASRCWSLWEATYTPSRPRASEALRLTPMDHQLRFTQHLSTRVAGQACVDTRITVCHVPQHQGVGGAFPLLAEPGAIHQLGVVLGAQAGGRGHQPDLGGPCKVACSVPQVLPYCGWERHTLPTPSTQGSACPYPVPGYCGLRVAINDCLELGCAALLCLHILDSDLHGRGSWGAGGSL